MYVYVSFVGNEYILGIKDYFEKKNFQNFIVFKNRIIKILFIEIFIYRLQLNIKK